MLINPINRFLATKYKNSTPYQQWKNKVGWPATNILADLILNNSLHRQSLRILEIACHQGGLLDSIYKPPQLKNKIHTYLGIDISEDALKKARKKYPQHTFIHLDALNEDSYKGNSISSNNTLIVCSGFFDYLSPGEIKQLLNNLKTKLSKKDNARMYVNYATDNPIYRIPLSNAFSITRSFYAKYDQYYGNKLIEEDGIKCIINTEGYPNKFYRYDPNEFSKILDVVDLEVVLNNSQSNLPIVYDSDFPASVRAYDHVCLRFK